MNESWTNPMSRQGLRWMPLVLLAAASLVSIVDTELTGSSPRRLALTLAVAAVAAVWALVAHPYGRLRGNPIVYLSVRVVLTAILVGLNPWFGIYTWYGYIETPEFVPKRLMYPSIGAFALIAAASYIGGYPTTPVLFVVWLVLGAGGFLLVRLITVAALKASEKELERERMLEELTVANRRLEEALTENRGLQSQLIIQAREAGVLDERARLAGEIHDTLAQALTGIIRQLEAADRSGELTGGERPHVDQVAELAREGLAEARRSLGALRPGQLEGSTLPDAIADVAGRAGLPVDVDVTGAVRPLPTDHEVVLLRVVQEALTNVGKHAGASRVGVTLTYFEDAVIVDVRDDGVGFRPEVVGARTDGTGVGLEAMRDRLARVEGSLVVESAPGEGTALVATVPCPAVVAA
ncbi:sensor histidine kinase [Cryptosporangium aurantiacum]|uniref:Oxygen sensor histidine kinase NreB n=1 Tax=Cryptosporangium aurantiacum TaxID=134849 RepID=A0A1M7RKW0_9ACTN|nr:sensor histidine kinase [Cryptosporangium aurantiacum]SHN46953.1 Signal transduction histidine kinase [Cryptosporangium aurantiacum]